MSTKTYTVLKGGENIYDISRKVNMPSGELLEHNDIENETQIIPEYTIIRLPYDRPSHPSKPITYEIFDSPREMHINRKGGARKWSFGDVHDWKDFKPVGPTYPENTNLYIVAAAYVPVGDESAKYYMEALSLGNYVERGRPDYTIGFNHSHLDEGHVEKPRSKPVPVKTEDSPSPGVATMPTTVIDLGEIVDDSWKTSWVPYEQQRVFEPKSRMWVHDMDSKRPDRELKLAPVTICGTFIKDDVLYGRTPGSVANGLWFGIPMDNLMADEELYGKVKDEDRWVMHKFNFSEKLIAIPLGILATAPNKLKKRLNKNKGESK